MSRRENLKFKSVIAIRSHAAVAYNGGLYITRNDNELLRVVFYMLVISMTIVKWHGNGPLYMKHREAQ